MNHFTSYGHEKIWLNGHMTPPHHATDVSGSHLKVLCNISLLSHKHRGFQVWSRNTKFTIVCEICDCGGRHPLNKDKIITICATFVSRGKHRHSYCN